MKTCETCGRFRPDSQGDCDCASIDRTLPPGTGDRFPIFTLISLFTAIGVEVAILFLKTYQPRGFDFSPLLVYPLATAGGAASIYSGWFAHLRGEAWGGKIAVLAIAVWVASLCALR
jgi:hypothetical protein